MSGRDQPGNSRPEAKRADQVIADALNEFRRVYKNINGILQAAGRELSAASNQVNGTFTNTQQQLQKAETEITVLSENVNRSGAPPNAGAKSLIVTAVEPKGGGIPANFDWGAPGPPSKGGDINWGAPGSSPPMAPAPNVDSAINWGAPAPR